MALKTLLMDAVLDSLPDNAPLVLARTIVERLHEALSTRGVEEGLECSCPRNETPVPPPPPPPPQVGLVEDDEMAYPTVIILRRALGAVQREGTFNDGAMGVLISQAMRASEWVEHHYTRGPDDE